LTTKAEKVFIFITLSTIYFFSIVHRVGIAVIAVDMMDELNASASLVGIMSSAYFFPYALVQIPVGILLDKKGVRKTIGSLGVIAAIGNITFALGPSLATVTIGRALVGAGVGGFYVSCLKALSIWFESGKFATLTGLLTAIGNFGAFFASSPMALLSVNIGWRGAYAAIAVAMSIFIGLVWISLKGEKHTSHASERSVSVDLRGIFTNRHFLIVMMIPFLSYGAYISFQGLWAGPYLAAVYGMDTATVGFFLTFISIGFIISTPFGGYLSDKVLRKRKPVLLIGLLLSFIFWISLTIFGATLTPLTLSSLLLLMGFATGFTYVLMVMSKELFPAEISGTAMASLNQFYFIGGGFFQFFMGYVLDAIFGGATTFASFQLIFVISAVSLFVSIILTVFAKETYAEIAD
jgi:predicted MFS family arabinose efflux permease